MSLKTKRLQAIKNIVATMDIGSQSDLLEELGKHGFELTQATLSRNLNELDIIKINNGRGKYRYTFQNSTTNTPLYNSPAFSSVGYKELNFTGNLAVIKTEPGYASTIAHELDTRMSYFLLGTIAGGNTIFAALREKTSHDEFKEQLELIVPKIQ